MIGRMIGILILVTLAGCGKSERERMLVEISHLQTELQKAESKLADTKKGALAVDRKKIVDHIDQREKGLYAFEKQEADGLNRWLGQSGEIPLTVILNENKTGQIESIELTYYVHSDAPPDKRVRVAGVYSGIVSAVIGPGFQRDALRGFAECMNRESLDQQSDTTYVTSLNGVNINGKYSSSGKMHTWVIEAEPKAGSHPVPMATQSAAPKAARTIPSDVPKLVKQLVEGGFKVKQEGTNFELKHPDVQCTVSIKSFDGKRPWSIYLVCAMDGLNAEQIVAYRKLLNLTTRLAANDVNVKAADVDELLKGSEQLKDGNGMCLQMFDKCEIHAFQVDQEISLVIRPTNEPFD